MAFAASCICRLAQYNMTYTQFKNYFPKWQNKYKKLIERNFITLGFHVEILFPFRLLLSCPLPFVSSPPLLTSLTCFAFNRLHVNLESHLCSQVTFYQVTFNCFFIQDLRYKQKKTKKSENLKDHELYKKNGVAIIRTYERRTPASATTSLLCCFRYRFYGTPSDFGLTLPSKKSRSKRGYSKENYLKLSRTCLLSFEWVLTFPVVWLVRPDQ